MTYSTGGLIQATDYNGFVGTSNPNTTANQLNTVYGIGNGNAGYGQTILPTVTTGTTVSYTNWQNLINVSKTIGSHQSTAITALNPPAQGDTIQALAAISTNLTSLYTNRLNAVAQGTTYNNVVTTATTWTSAITFTHTVTFPSADQARYFFNAGGQLSLNFSHPTGAGMNALWNTLATACGTITLSALSSGSATIAGVSYTGVNKVGGSGTPTTLLNSNGYYALSTSYVQIFKQIATTGPAGYTGSFITVDVLSNGTVGTNGDKGSVITFRVIFDEVPNGGTTIVTAAGTTSTVTVKPPSASYITNTWGTATLAGSVTGS